MKRKLTEIEWSAVFGFRCRSKRGEQLTRAQHKLCATAYAEDGERYAAMGEHVFAETAPFGSTVRK